MSKTTSALTGAMSGAASGAVIGGGVPGAVIGGAVGLIGGLISGGAADDKRAQAEAAAAEAFRMIAAMDLSPDESKALIIEKLKSAGVYTPKMEENLAQLPDTNFEQIKADPRLKQAQMESLQTLQRTGRVGLGPQERAALAEAQDQEAREAKGRAAGITQQMAARGQGGGGAELAAQLASSQSEAATGSLAALRAGSMASQAALEGARSSGALAGQMGAQEYAQEAAKAGAKDATTRFNIQNQIQSQRQNIASQNEAQARNLTEQQRIQDINAATANQEQARQSQARRQKWQDDMNRTLALSNARMGQASGMFQEAAGQDQGFGTIMSGVGQLASAYGAANKTPTEKKTTSDWNVPDQTPEGKSPYKFAEGGVVSPPIDEDQEIRDLMAMRKKAYINLDTNKQSVPKYADGGMLLDKIESGDILQGKKGGVVPGQPKVEGDSLKNDTVHALLSPGELVVPRHVMHGHKPGERAKKFVDAMLALHELKTKK
jgi:hypothetical protein